MRNEGFGAVPVGRRSRLYRPLCADSGRRKFLVVLGLAYHRPDEAFYLGLIVIVVQAGAHESIERGCAATESHRC
jgi:hypothetical protein